MSTPRSGTAEPRGNVFVVEDEAVVSMFLEHVLAHLGFTVCGRAARAEEALREIPVSGADVVLMDVNLGSGSTGLDVATSLRGRSFVAPVVFLSAYPREHWGAQLDALEPCAYAEKPVSEEGLLRAMVEALKAEPRA